MKIKNFTSLLKDARISYFEVKQKLIFLMRTGFPQLVRVDVDIRLFREIKVRICLVKIQSVGSETGVTSQGRKPG